MQTTPTARNSADAADAAAVLLRDLIDYAGLFPPASLAMAPSVANYDTYSRSQWSWILGRFIVPVARLAEFEEAFAGLPPPTPGTGFTDWRLSVLLGSDPLADVAGIRQFNARLASSSSGRRAFIESVEVKVASPGEISRLSGIIPAELASYFEFPLPGSAECIAGGGWLWAQSQDSDGRRDGRQVSCSRERGRIRSPVCGSQCAIQGDCGTASSAALGAPVHLSSRQSIRNHAWFCKCFSGSCVFAGWNGREDCRSVAR